ncbi:MAG: response regulator transcription factor [Sphingobacteriaceae bacterium]|nr:response regulator transcription factor [Sphingobacteriaceae bacterium]
MTNLSPTLDIVYRVSLHSIWFMKKILVIEDERMMLKILEFRLKKEGYEVLIAADGKTGLSMIASELPDLILTDIMMPYVSGLEIINHVRNVLQKNTPIIILSAVGLEKTVVEAFSLGADDFISKPFSPEELSIRVRKYLRR